MSERSTTTTRLTHRRTSRFWPLALLLALSGGNAVAQPSGEYRTVTVDDPFLEMHTGPGVGYPVFHVVDRGSTVEIMMRRTDWFQVRTPDGTEGWVDRAQMERTLVPSGSPRVP